MEYNTQQRKLPLPEYGRSVPTCVMRMTTIINYGITLLLWQTSSWISTIR